MFRTALFYLDDSAFVNASPSGRKRGLWGGGGCLHL